MDNNTYLNTPALWINKYLQNNIPLDVGFGIPFFPSTPSTIDNLTDTFTVISPDVTNPEKTFRYGYAGVMATWDRMFRMNKKSFPHIKCEQMMYYFYATEENAIVNMIQVQEAVLRLLDRLDESAQEVNDWCSNRRVNLGTSQNPSTVDNMFFFHTFKVYQLEEVRDIIDFGTARTYAGNKIIIEYDYHQMPSLTNANWQPESPSLTGDNKIII